MALQWSFEYFWHQSGFNTIVFAPLLSLSQCISYYGKYMEKYFYSWKFMLFKYMGQILTRGGISLLDQKYLSIYILNVKCCYTFVLLYFTDLCYFYINVYYVI